MAKRKPEKNHPPSLFAERYRLERELGCGGGGVVYLAEDQRSPKTRVAVKILLHAKDADPALRSALENEFRALTSLRHRNLAKVLDFGATPESIHVSSEFIDGVDLLEASREADLNTVFRFVVETLRALDYLHKRGVLHLDLKPANILVADPTGHGDASVRLIDFGIAQWKRLGMESQGAEFSGTAPYAAPEQILGQALSPATDLYALGMILHLLFTKRFPFANQDPMQMMQMQIYQEAVRPSSLHEALPESFADFLQRAVAKDPRARFTSAAAMLEAINFSLEEKFTLRDAMAPASVLEESDFNFRRVPLQTLLLTAQQGGVSRIAVVGKRGFGKSRLLLRLKETLQLQGQHPFYFTEAPPNTSFLLSERSALILDGPLGANTLSHPAPLFLAAEDTSTVPPGFTLEVLKPLDTRELAEFLSSEIAEFPAEGVPILAQQCEGRIDRLETLLQALREEGALAWGDTGWRWSGPESFDLDGLEERHQTRLHQRLAQVLELLRCCPLGLSSAALAGILGMDVSLLEKQLQTWREIGAILGREQDGGLLWLAPENPMSDGSVSGHDWKERQSDLERHYEAGEFRLGAHLAEGLSEGRKNLAKLPPEIRVWGARHFAATGQNEQALAFLPPTAPNSDSLAGLYWEVRTRCEGAQGKLESAQTSLREALGHYCAAQDLSGLARGSNLTGWIEKKLGRSQEAIQAYEHSLAYAIQGKDTYAQGLAEMNLGTVFHDQGRLEIAAQYYDKALQSAVKSGHPLLQIKLNQNRVNLYYTMGRASEAEAGCYELLRLALRHSFPEEQAAAFNFLSLIAGQRGDTEGQRRSLDQAIATLADRPQSSLLPQLYFNRSHLLWSLEKFPAAQLDAEAALGYARRQGNPFISAWGELLLGKILRDRRKPDLEGAERHMDRALRQMKEQNLKHLLWEVEFDLGLLAKRRHDLKAAAEHLKAAKTELQSVLPELPETQRQSYLRDRKLERISEELNNL